MATLYTSSTSDMTPLFHPRGSSSILVGSNRADSKDGPDKGCCWHPGGGGHALSVGMTRSGKGLQIVGALLQYFASCVVIDPKGENAWITSERRRALGNRVVILDPFDEVNRRYGSKVGVRETTTRFNPLSVIDPRSPDFAEDVMMLAEAVIIETGGDSHWSESAKQLITGLMAAIIEQASPGQASFRQVRKLLTAPDLELSKAVELLHKRNPNSLGGRLLRRFLGTERTNQKTGEKSYHPSPEISSIRSTADTQTFMFESERLVSSMEAAGDARLSTGDITDRLLNTMETDAQAFDLRELATGRVTLFLVLPVDRLQTYGRWLRMILTLTIRAITRHDTPPDPPVLFILDELGTINPGGGLRMIEQAYGLMAGMGIRIWGFVQDLNQLQTDYPKSWGTFIANSEMVQLLKVNDDETANYFSRRLGLKQMKRVQNNLPHTYDAPVLRPDEIIEVTAQKENIIIFAGGRNVRMQKVNYFADPRFRGLYRDNPLFAKSAPSTPPSSGQSGPADTVPPINVDRLAELGKAAAGKVSGWFTARREAAARAAADAAAAREEAVQAEQRRATEEAAMAERSRYASMIRNAK